MFKLTLELSDDIVSTEGSIGLTASIRRLRDKEVDVASKVMGVWNVQSIGSDTLDPESIDIAYTFGSDSTVSIRETYRFDVSVLGSRILGVWDVYAIGSDILDSNSLKIEYTFGNDYSVVLDSTMAVQDTTRSSSTNGEWRFDYRDTVLVVSFWDTPGGRIETGKVTFDTDALTIPVNGFMYWSTDKRTVIFRKKDPVSGFSAPEDSVVTNGGGWVFGTEDSLLTVTVRGITEAGKVTFDTKGSTVPIDGYMFWNTAGRSLIVFKKLADVSGGSTTLSSTLSVDAIAGDIDILNFTVPRSIQVTLADTADSKFEVEGLFTPKNVGTSLKPRFKTNGMVSARFRHLFVTIDVSIVSGTSS